MLKGIRQAAYLTAVAVHYVLLHFSFIVAASADFNMIIFFLNVPYLVLFYVKFVLAQNALSAVLCGIVCVVPFVIYAIYLVLTFNGSKVALRTLVSANIVVNVHVSHFVAVFSAVCKYDFHIVFPAVDTHINGRGCFFIYINIYSVGEHLIGFRIVTANHKP